MVKIIVAVVLVVLFVILSVIDYRFIFKKRMAKNQFVKELIAIAQARKSFIFDAHELAECLEVTVRSARRIMNKIMDSGYGKLHAKEMAVSGGRPKALIEILFQ